MQKLILWDVDGTLLHTGGVSGEAMRAAMGQVIGPLDARERTFYSGKTDWQIIHETFPDLPLSVVGEKLKDFSAAYLAELQRRRGAMQERSRLMPGVVALLEALHQHAVQAPLTGNIAAVARIKIESFALHPYLDLTAGAYGDDHYERTRLVPIAAERAQRAYGRSFIGRDIVVVGDTPNDIRCGASNGAYTVAVATGPYSFDELQAHRPDALLADLSDTKTALAAILG
jgi:phosphoglycolate phosphatase-like HAD superfamily hydrolase